jgi:GAF domain-containing protein
LAHPRHERPPEKLGGLGAGRLGAEPFSEDDAELLATVARQIAFAVENALAFQETAALEDWPRKSASRTGSGRSTAVQEERVATYRAAVLQSPQEVRARDLLVVERVRDVGLDLVAL